LGECFFFFFFFSIVVSTSRCGRDNPGSNPGHGKQLCSVAVTALWANFLFVSLTFSYLKVYLEGGAPRWENVFFFFYYYLSNLMIKISRRNVDNCFDTCRRYDMVF
jgi:hypothetical protein